MQIPQIYLNKKGFTLVETLVAVTVLLLVIIGPMTIAQKGIQNAYYAKDQFTAVYLAQEAMEAVREARDADAIGVYTDPSGNTSTSDWINTFSSDCFSSGLVGICAYNPVSKAFEVCGSSQCILKIQTDGSYTYQPNSGYVVSPFKRTVTIGDSVNGGIPVTVDVSWSARVFGGSIKHIVLQTWIYDHYERYEN